MTLPDAPGTDYGERHPEPTRPPGVYQSPARVAHGRLSQIGEAYWTVYFGPTLLGYFDERRGPAERLATMSSD